MAPVALPARLNHVVFGMGLPSLMLVTRALQVKCGKYDQLKAAEARGRASAVARYAGAL